MIKPIFQIIGNGYTASGTSIIDYSVENYTALITSYPYASNIGKIAYVKNFELPYRRSGLYYANPSKGAWVRTADIGKIGSKNIDETGLADNFIPVYSEVDGVYKVKDFSATNQKFTPAGEIEATDTQSAIEELDTEKVKRITSVDNQLTRFDGTGGDIQGSEILVSDTKDITNISTIQHDIAYTETGDEPVGTEFWDNGNETYTIVLPNGVRMQLGQEMPINVVNQSGGDLLNGEVVAFDGSVGASGKIKVKKMIADGSIPAYYTLGVVTQEVIANGEVGKITIIGAVRGFNTTGTPVGEVWEYGDELFVSPTTAGKLTKIKPNYPNFRISIGIVVVAHANVGTIAVRPTFLPDEYLQQFAITKEPTGFLNPQNVIVTGDSTTRTITLSGTDWQAFYRNEKVSALVSGWTSAAHGTDTTKSYFLHYNGSDFTWSETTTLNPVDFYSDVLISLAFYNSNDGVWVYQRECHGLMQWQGHRQAHLTIGTYRASGGTLGDYVLNSTTPADRRPSISSSLIYDEDLPTIQNALPVGTYANFYLSGAGGTANFITGSTDIVPLSSNQPYFNEFTGGTWQQTLMSTGSYINIFVVAIPMSTDTESQKIRWLFVQGQKQFSQLVDAQVETPNDINLGNLTDLTPELVYTSKIIVRYIGGNWQIIEVQDLTGTKLSQAQSPTGNYLSSVASDNTIEGIGTPESPLSVASGLPAIKIADGSISNEEFQFLDGVSSNIQTQLNGKQASLGFTPENVANKVTSFQATPTDTAYISEKLAKDSLDLKADLNNATQTITADTINAETIVLDGTDLATTFPKIIKDNFTVAPSTTETITINLPSTNLSYDLFISGTVNNGVISYSAKIATTNDNTPMLLTRLAHMYFQGEKLRLIDPITYATNQGLFNVIEAQTNDTSYGLVPSGLGLLLKFQVANINTIETANCKYVITYTTS